MKATPQFFQMRVSNEDRERLRALAAEEGKSQAMVVKDLVRETIALRRAAQSERWGPRLFGTDAETPDEAA